MISFDDGKPKERNHALDILRLFAPLRKAVQICVARDAAADGGRKCHAPKEWRPVGNMRFFVDIN